MQHIAAIGFDLFDTLITVQNLGLQEALGRLVHCLQAEGLEVQPDTFLPVYRKSARDFMEAARKDGKETHNRFWISAALHEVEQRIPPDDPRISRAVDSYFSAFLDHATLLPGTLEMLDTLRDRYRLGLLSNFTHAPAVQRILSKLGLEPFLEVTLISGELGYRKPHARVFQELTRQFCVPKAHIAFVGDDLHADVQGSQQAGLQPIWTTYAREYKATLTHDIAERPGDNPDPPRWAQSTRSPSTTAEADVDAAGVPTIASWDDLLTLLEG